jgi:hypothetical protein
MTVKWTDLNPGDFFFIEVEEYGSMLYQKIMPKNGYNAVLLNSGELCLLHTPDHSNKLYQKVTVTFNIHNYSDNE